MKWRPVTKAFRLLWHFCQKIMRCISIRQPWASQKPFGFFGISAGPKRTALISLGLTSQKPFGFFGISANINFVQIPNTVITVTKAFRLLWHFCPGMQSVEHVQLPARSQKPFGFFGISAKEQQERNRMAQKPCHKSLSASLAFLPRTKNEDHRSNHRRHKSLSASLAFLPKERTKK